MAVIGQGYDRLMGGQMDLEEYQGMIWNYNQSQKKANGGVSSDNYFPTADEVEQMHIRTAETVARAKLN